MKRIDIAATVYSILLGTLMLIAGDTGRSGHKMGILVPALLFWGIVLVVSAASMFIKVKHTRYLMIIVMLALPVHTFVIVWPNILVLGPAILLLVVFPIIIALMLFWDRISGIDDYE